MNPYIDIFAPDGTVLCSPLITKEAECEQELMRSDFVKLSWLDVDGSTLPAGAYIMHDGEKYTLLDPYAPEQKDEATYSFQPEFQSRVMAWGKIPLLFYTRDAQGNVASKEPDWTLTDSAQNFINYIARAISTETGEEWTGVAAADLAGFKTVAFNAVDILSGLSAVCSEWETEWRADKATRTLYLGKAMFDGASVPTLEVGRNIGVPSVTENTEGFFNRFYVFGSTRNITQDYEGANANNLVNKRLTLDPAVFPDGYIDRRTNAGDPVFTKVLTFDDVYPRSNLVVLEARPRLMYTTQQGTTDKVQIGTDSNGNPIYDQYAIWYVQLGTKSANGKVTPFRLANTETYSSDNPDGVLILGKNLSVHFESGSLTGREFELKYHKDGGSETSADGQQFVIKPGDFEIVYSKDGDYIVPSLTGVVPCEDDKAILFNLRMPQEYVVAAYEELKAAADKAIAGYEQDRNNYEFNSNPIAFDADPALLGLEVGQHVRFRNGDYEYDTRIISITKKLDFSCEQTIRIGNETIKGTTQTLRDEVTNANKDINVMVAFNALTQSTINNYNRTQQLILEGFDRIAKMWQFDPKKPDTIFTPYAAYSHGNIAAYGDAASAGGSGSGGGVDLSTINNLLKDYLLISNAAQTYSRIGHSHSFADITATPTTIAGYGIADAHINGTTITLGQTSLKVLTSITKDMVEKVLTGDISSHTHSQYLTAHQTIYSLSFEAGSFSAGSYNPATGAATLKVPTSTDHISEGANKFFTDARAVAALKSVTDALGARIVPFEQMFEFATVAGRKTIKAKFPFWSVENVAAYGEVSAAGSGSSGGVDMNVVQNLLADYLTIKQAAQTYQPKGDYALNSALTAYLSKTEAASTYAPKSHTHAFSAITATPTTLAGYGITDAKIANGTITLGANSITPLTAITKAMVEGVLTGNITSHTHSQYLTAHQTIYSLSFEAGSFSAGSYNPATGAATLKVPTSTDHISEGANKFFTDARAVAALKSVTDALGARIVPFEQMFEFATVAGRKTIKAKFPFWSVENVAAYGEVSAAGSGSSGGVDMNVVQNLLADYLTIKQAAQTYQPKGDYALNSALTAYLSKTEAASTYAPKSHTHAFSAITATPTTLAGYGITDAKIANGTITLGANSITPLTAITKAMVEGVLTGNITSHTHSQYLTAHQTIYSLSFEAGSFSAGSYNPATGAATLKVPTSTDHISEGANKFFTDARAVAALKSVTDALGARIVPFEQMFEFATVAGRKTIKAKFPFWSVENVAAYGEVSAAGSGSSGGVDMNVVQNLLADYLTIKQAAQTYQPKGDYALNSALTAYLSKTEAASTYAPKSHTHAFSAITATPTTLAGYGITDAKIANGTITLGANSITPLTAITKAMVEGVLTGNITSHTHSQYALASALSGYLPLTGGSMANTNKVGNLNADLLDGYHESSFVRDRLLFDKADYQHVVILLWKTAEVTTHRLSGQLFTYQGGSARYNVADIDFWYSRWSSGMDNYFKLETFGQSIHFKLVTCNYNGEEWWGLQYTGVQAVQFYFRGTQRSISFTKVHYYTSNTQTVVNAEVNGSIVDRSAKLSTFMVGAAKNALTSDNVASASKLADDTTFTAWGQPFFQNGVPKSVTGALSGVPSIANGEVKLSFAPTFAAFLKGAAALPVYVGGLLVSNLYDDGSKVPTNGIYSKGNIHTSGSIKIGEATFSYDSAKGAVKVDKPLYSEGNIAAYGDAASAGGSGSGSGGGGVDMSTVQTLLADYLTTEKAAQIYQPKGAYLTPDTVAAYAVTALGISGNDLTWTKNGAVNKITVPYAATASRMKIADVRGTAHAPNYWHGSELAAWFNNTGMPRTDWYSGLTFIGWTPDTYSAWQIAACSGTGADPDKNMYFRVGRGTAWESWQKVLTDANYTSIVTKVGTATVGASNRPVYLNAGVPTACAYTFGNASGNAALSNGTLCANLNADMLDGWHKDDIRRGALRFSVVHNQSDNTPYDLNDLTEGLASNYNSPQYWKNAPTGMGYGCVLALYRAISPTLSGQLAWDMTADANDYTKGLYWRIRGADAWGKWHQLAFSDSNIASATKLQTARKIWGETFDGTADVTGALSNVSDITMSGMLSGVNTIRLSSYFFLTHPKAEGKGFYLSPTENGDLSFSTHTNYSWNKTWLTIARDTGLVFAKGGIQLPYTGGAWITMATRANQLTAAISNTEANAHSLFCVKSFRGDAVAFGGLGNNIGFYGFTKEDIEANTNRLAWQARWNAQTGNFLMTGTLTAGSFIKDGGTAAQFLKADGSVDSNAYALASALGNYLPLAGGTMRNTNLVGNLNADLLDGHHGKDYAGAHSYNFPNGFLVKLNATANADRMISVHILGNTFRNDTEPIDTVVQFYNYHSGDSIIGMTAMHNGFDFGAIRVFNYGGYICLWFQQTRTSQSFVIRAYDTNHDGLISATVTNAAVPASGVTRSKTIIPVKSAVFGETGDLTVPGRVLYLGTTGVWFKYDPTTDTVQCNKTIMSTQNIAAYGG